MPNDTIKRRNFLKKTAIAAIGTGAMLSAYSIHPPRVLGAGERVGIALIGCGGMGRGDLKDFLLFPQVECVAVCDVYDLNAGRAQQMADGKPKIYRDFRRLFDEGSGGIDAVINATPDHWHALPTIYACQAGKDVYQEKPLSTSIVEGRKMVEAARKNGRVVQTGMQQRSGTHFQRAVEIVQSGILGEISLVRTWNYGNSYPEGIGNPANEEPPPGLDWDMYLGPAPWVPFNKNRLGGTFRYFWNYSGGTMTDWGTHLIDIVHWAMKVDYPKAVHASGGKFCMKDNSETPDLVEATFEYPGFICTYTNSNLNARAIDGKGYGIQFHGTNGTLFLDRDGYELFPEFKNTGGQMEGRAPTIKSRGSDQHLPHVENFLDCIKTRKKPISEVEVCHYATMAPHLANIALWTGQKIEWDGINEKITNVPDANKYLVKEYRTPWRLPDV